MKIDLFNVNIACKQKTKIRNFYYEVVHAITVIDIINDYL